jgi:hypothetical protein
MLKFKNWLENLSGPGNGGTMDPSIDDVEAMAFGNAKKGVGAFPQYSQNDNPPNNGKISPDANYYPLTRKMSKKRMKKR